MSDPARAHALTAFMARRSAQVPPQSTAQVRIMSERDFVNVRGRYASSEFRQNAESVLEQALPARANTCTVGAHEVYWLGPDEWLVSSPLHGDVCARLGEGLAGQSVAVNAQSGGLLQLTLSGDAVRDILAMGCTLDFHPGKFRPGHCAQTAFGKASALIALMDDGPVFNLIVRRSFAEYFALWLDHAGREHGLDFVSG